jgi:uncharacterized DUF497 family protein/uncharacterized protein (DUF4415 family)
LYTVTAFEWDPRKAAGNARKHGVRFADAVTALEDDRAITLRDDASGEERWATIGMDAAGRTLVVVYTWRGNNIRIILGAPGDARRVPAVFGEHMKQEYDFSKGKRGAVAPPPANKTRVTIRLDADVLDWFRNEVDRAGGGNYQSLINLALRDFVSRSHEPLEKTLRRVIREELTRAG